MLSYSHSFALCLSPPFALAELAVELFCPYLHGQFERHLLGWESPFLLWLTWQQQTTAAKKSAVIYAIMCTVLSNQNGLGFSFAQFYAHNVHAGYLSTEEKREKPSERHKNNTKAPAKPQSKCLAQ